METSEENFGITCGRINNRSCVSPELQAYSEAKLREAEKREQEWLEKPLVIDRILNKIKRVCKTR